MTCFWRFQIKLCRIHNSRCLKSRIWSAYHAMINHPNDPHLASHWWWHVFRLVLIWSQSVGTYFWLSWSWSCQVVFDQFDNGALRFMEGSVPPGPLPSSYSLPLPLCLRSVRDLLSLLETNILILIGSMDRKRLGLGGRLRWESLSFNLNFKVNRISTLSEFQTIFPSVFNIYILPLPLNTLESL